MQEKEDTIEMQKENIKQLQLSLDQTRKELESQVMVKSQSNDKLNQYVKELRESVSKGEQEIIELKEANR